MASLSRAAAMLAAIGCAASALAAPVPLTYVEQSATLGGEPFTIRVPAGTTLELLVGGLDVPRMLHFGAHGELFAGSRGGKVYRFRPPYRQAEVLVRLDDYPHSIATRTGEMLIARTVGLYRAPYTPGQRAIDPDSVELLAPLPAGGGHSSRTVRIGPDGRAYVSLGIAGNCSNQFIGADYAFNARRGGVMVLDETRDPPEWQPFATGLRNPVGFDWHPLTGVAYASNNGPDHLGYDQPPEVFARLDPGSFHGQPWYQFDGRSMVRDDCIDRPPPRSDPVPPAATFPARNAPLGMAFAGRGTRLPIPFGDAVVALHGSWGTQPDGGAGGSPATRRVPALVVVRFDDGEAHSVEDLVTGFQLDDGRRWARPAGVAFGPDGALYFTSDAGLQGLFRLRSAAP